MRQFIPFEDDWDAFESLCAGTLIPYRVGLVCVHEPVVSTQAPALVFNTQSVCAPIGVALSVDSSSM